MRRTGLVSRTRTQLARSTPVSATDPLVNNSQESRGEERDLSIMCGVFDAAAALVSCMLREGRGRGGAVSERYVHRSRRG